MELFDRGNMTRSIRGSSGSPAKKEESMDDKNNFEDDGRVKTAKTPRQSAV